MPTFRTVPSIQCYFQEIIRWHLWLSRGTQSCKAQWVKETLREIRTKFWIVKGRSLVRSVIYHFVVCQRFEGPACRAPPPPTLPEFRLREEPPFSFTGVDFAGPLYVPLAWLQPTKYGFASLPFCVTRAVHLDIVTDMSTETFMRCLKCFAARRGVPCKFVSDNRKTFKVHLCSKTMQCRSICPAI